MQYAAGVNVWGYRGPVVARKKRGEIRLVVVGGAPYADEYIKQVRRAGERDGEPGPRPWSRPWSR